MSKSLGNSPEPLELIGKYGADGVRIGMLLCSPAGNDLLYEDTLPEQGRNFANKIWNAFRLVKGWKIDENIPQPAHAKAAVSWMEEILRKATTDVDTDFRKFRISEALMDVYKLFWDEFSGWYLEIIKPEYEKPADKTTYDATIGFFDRLLRLLHPFMPFITEEIWQLLEEREEGESIMISSMPATKKSDKELIARFDLVRETISAIRTVRKARNLPAREGIVLCIRSAEKDFDTIFIPVIAKLCNISDIRFVSVKEEGAASFMVRTTEFYIPLGDKLDIEAERKRIEEELIYYRGFLESVMKKLDNERFVKSAPLNIIDMERKKQLDAGMKIKALEERLKELF